MDGGSALMKSALEFAVARSMLGDLVSRWIVMVLVGGAVDFSVGCECFGEKTRKNRDGGSAARVWVSLTTLYQANSYSTRQDVWSYKGSHTDKSSSTVVLV